jgi:hypothetical protein
MPCSPLKVNRHFGGTCHLHFQSQRICQAKKKHGSRWQSEHMALLATCFHVCFLLSLFFDPEDGNDMFLLNFVWLSMDYMVLHPEDRTLHNHWCENFKSYKGYLNSNLVFGSLWQTWGCHNDDYWDYSFLEYDAVGFGRCVPTYQIYLPTRLQSIISQETVILNTKHLTRWWKQTWFSKCYVWKWPRWWRVSKVIIMLILKHCHLHHHHWQNGPFWGIAFLRRICQICLELNHLVPGSITGPPVTGGHKYGKLVLLVGGWTQGWQHCSVK